MKGVVLLVGSSVVIPLWNVGAFSTHIGYNLGKQCRAISPMIELHMDPSSLASIVDPSSMASMMGDISIAMGGAAAGYFSQVPRINSLQLELDQTKAELEEETSRLEGQLKEAEEKLFLLDNEFEDQTARFKRRYDMEAKARLDKQIQRIKSDYKDRLESRQREMRVQKEIELEQEKSRLLVNSLDRFKTVTNQSPDQISELRFQSIQLKEMNQQLASALNDATSEVDRLRQAVKEYSQKRFFGLF